MTSECFSRNDVFATLVICAAETSAAQSRFPVFFVVVFFLLCERCVWPIQSLRFLLRQKVSLGYSVKDDPILELVCSRCQCLSNTELIAGRFLLNVVVKCTLC